MRVRTILEYAGPATPHVPTSTFSSCDIVHASQSHERKWRAAYSASHSFHAGTFSCLERDRTIGDYSVHACHLNGWPYHYICTTLTDHTFVRFAAAGDSLRRSWPF